MGQKDREGSETDVILIAIHDGVGGGVRGKARHSGIYS